MNKYKIYLCLAVLFLLTNGCYQSNKVSIETHFWAPSSFSPNNDGLNETLNIHPVYGVVIQGFHLTVYDDMLKEIFKSENIYDSWDGKYNNVDVSAGTYEYQILYNASIDSINFEYYITSSRVNLFR